ncbi:hypothetical protein LTR53_020094, partial [Teratosphaeriaceae sp. CCFEE 6253]
PRLRAQGVQHQHLPRVHPRRQRWLLPAQARQVRGARRLLPDAPDAQRPRLPAQRRHPAPRPQVRQPPPRPRRHMQDLRLWHLEALREPVQQRYHQQHAGLRLLDGAR